MGQRASVSEYATVRVCLDQPTAVPGDVVSGEISAVVIARTRLGELDARLRCTLVAGVDADRSKSTLLDQNIVCKKFNAGYLEPGSYKFPFRFHLPRSAPPSTEFENVDNSAGAVVKVSVAYAVHAEVRGGGAGGSGWFSSKQVAHSQSLEVNATPTLQTITTGSLNSKVDSGFSLFRTHGSIQARAFCLPSSVRPGEKCAITVYLRNNTNAAFILRNVKLEQRVMARTRTAAREHSQKWVLHRSATHETEEEWKDPNDDGDDGDGSRGGATGATARGAGPAKKSAKTPAIEAKAVGTQYNHHPTSPPPPPPPPSPPSASSPAPKAADFGAKKKSTCARFSATIPLNVRHQSFSLDQASVTHAVVFTLQPCTFFGQNFHLRLPIQIALASEASSSHNEAAQQTQTTDHTSSHSVSVHHDEIPLAEAVPEPAPSPSAPPMASLASHPADAMTSAGSGAGEGRK